MALMFQRLARNYAKRGFYPTDTESMERLIQLLAPAPDGRRMYALDPCCGEGAALAEVKHHLGAEVLHADGIEVDAERAAAAKGRLDRCARADLFDTMTGKGGYGLLFLNPPYGQTVSDAGGSGERAEKRLEHAVYRRVVHSLTPGGVLMLLVPRNTVDKRLAGWLGGSFERLQVFEAVDKTFKQVVIVGVRRPRVAPASVQTEARNALLAALAPEAELPELPAQWNEAPYVVPATRALPRLEAGRIDADQLAEVIDQHPGLWPSFDLVFGSAVTTARRPLCQPSDWHLSLSIAAGEVGGLVRARDGRRMLIKGDTHKARTRAVEEHFNQKTGDHIATEVKQTERFEPVITGIDLTPDSPTYGEVFTIR